MKHPDFDKAFAPTPEIVRLSMEAAFRKGEKAMKLRHKIIAMISAAAVLAIACGVFALALPNEPKPDVVSQPHLSETLASEEATVYYTAKGNYYHFIEDCSGMEGAEIHSFAEAQADEKKPCPVCVLRKVYATENGKYCHYDEHCSGMMNAVVDTETNWYDAGKSYCLICMEPNTWIASDDPYYHYDMACCGDAAVGATENAALELNLFPCPVCTYGSIAPTPEPTETAYGGSITMDASGEILHLESRPMPTEAPYDANATLPPRVTAAPTSSPIPVEEDFFHGSEAAEEQIVYYNENGQYYHFYMHCSGMMGAKYHTLTEAKQAGKPACPVCVPDEVDGSLVYYTDDPSHPDSEEPFYPTDAVPEDVEITPAKLGSDIFLNVFGAYMFDVFENYGYINCDSRGTVSTDGVLTEEIQFHFSEDGADFTPVIVTVESRDENILSGSIFLNFVNFSGKDFREQCSPWYQNVCAGASDTMEGIGILAAGSGGMAEVPQQITAFFDSELKPSVCVLDYESSSGYITLSYDINGDEASLASMNYNISRA